MSKIVIYDLRPIDIETFLDELTPAQTETVLGGGSPYIYINNITDSVSINSSGDNTVEAAGINSVSYHDNKINTTDYSRSNHTIFYSY
ncbi:hypothetical protein JYQ62_25290 [Nostoc sp. UHCC 0702]|nr:hypothetical protein JYQ62_25290 [Nostoc sp. UHCC 0702]